MQLIRNLIVLSVLLTIATFIYKELRTHTTPQQVSAATTTSVNFQSSNEDIHNPERGFMKQANIHVHQAFSTSKIARKQPSDSVVWVYFHLENYRDPRDGKGVVLSNYQGRLLEPIGSGKGLDTVNNTFKEARKKGLKLVIRFLYIGYGGIGSTSSNPEPDAPIEWVIKHADQLKPLLQSNTDVIAAVQTGFVGYWGEWHSSKYLNPLDKRKAVIDTVLAMTPNNRMTQLRYPRYKQRLYGGPLTDSQAYNQTPVARIGHHNDAFLRDENDGGTFKSVTRGVKITNYCDNYPGGVIPCWRNYIGKDSRFLPVGGEAGTHSSTPSQYAACSNALLQLSNMHWSFIHNGYSMTTLNHWVNQGCMPEIRRRLGYRLVLDNLNISHQVNPGAAISFQLKLHNEGFAAPYNERPLFLVLENKSTGNKKTITLKSNANPKTTDPRWWQPGQSITINEQVYTPSSLAAGNYNVYLWLPDAYQSIRNRTEYAIRFANQNVWKSNTGYNLLFSNLQVGGSPVTQPPTVTSLPTDKPTITPTPTPGTPGDGNYDGLVDGKDFIIWLSHFGQDVGGANNGDYDGNGKVRIYDYVVWVKNY